MCHHSPYVPFELVDLELLLECCIISLQHSNLSLEFFGALALLGKQHRCCFSSFALDLGLLYGGLELLLESEASIGRRL